MKKILAALFFISSLQALPLGNPWEASLLDEGIFLDCCSLPLLPISASYRFGYEYDHVVNRHLETDGAAHASLRQVEIYTNAGTVALNFCDRFDLFGTFGASQFWVTTHVNSFNSDHLTENVSSLLYFNTASDFSWSVGVRGTIFSCCNFAVGGEVEYFAARPSISTTFDPNISRVIYPADTLFKYREWQFGLGATYQICLAQSIQALPYIGITWSRVEVDMQNSAQSMNNLTFTFLDLREQKQWGYAVGVTLTGCEKFQITLENRFASEKALSFNVGMQF